MNSCLNFDYFENEVNIDASEKSFKELLQPIKLPPKVTEESLAQIITACILRKAYIVPSAWSKWILLAALEELLGNSAPIIDEKQLNELQGKPVNPTVSSSGFDENLLEVSRLNSSTGTNYEEMLKDIASVDPNFKCSMSDLISSTPKVQNSLCPKHDCTPSRLYVDRSVGQMSPWQKDVCHVDVQCGSGAWNISSVGVQTDKYTVDVSVQYDLPLTSVIKNTNVSSTQTNFRIKNVFTQTEMQTKKPIKNVSTQTYLQATKLIKDISTQTYLQATKLIKDISTQTYLQATKLIKDISTQTDIKQTSDTDCQTSTWQLFRIAGISRKKTPRNINTIINDGQILKLFYGRPLIGTRSLLQAPSIPLQMISHFPIFDPRIVNDKPFDLVYPSDSSEFGESASSSSHSRLEYNSIPSSINYAMEIDDSL